ncbi:MAG: hypothetical protein JWL89_525 [Candidatus Saccharibacteria bacterium]|nr:hypothetical protein [Candidatus Saccharibacteria bacterium]
MDNEASGQNEGSSGRLALPTTGTIVDKMVKADVTGAADISERMHQSNLMNEPLPLLRILPVYELLSIEAEKAESTEEQDRLSELADLAKMAILITCAHDVSKSDRAEMISIVQEKLDGLSMIDYDRLVLQSLINNSNS